MGKENRISSCANTVVDGEFSRKCSFDSVNGTENQSNLKEQVDTGRAWLILAVGLANYIVLFGCYMSFGIFQSYYLKVMFSDTPADVVSWISTVSTSLMLVCGPVAGPLMSVLGIKPTLALGSILGPLGLLLASFSSQVWQLVLTQGVMFGFGAAILINCSVTLTSIWFEKKRQFALVVLSFGSPLGGLFFVPVISFVLNGVGLSWAFRILFAISFVITCVGVFVLKPRQGFKSDSKPLNLSLLKDKYIILLVLYCLATGMAELIPFQYFLASIVDMGFNKGLSYNLLLIFCGASLLCRITMVLISNRVGITNMMLVSNTLTGIFTLAMWYTSTSIPTSLVYYVILGYVSGVGFSAGPVLVGAQYPKELVSQANGLLYLAYGGSYLISGPLAGFIFDKVGHRTSYSEVILVCGAFYLLSGAIALGIRIYSRKYIPRLKNGPL
ncbi:Monocarboxylate transporter 13 [Zancudomyces culisetae]|uniref:Monocarboxylate transporter 13 n=1 Tax=Zancudomyces culisetae TaxID=1213189 RepID=A0A1R1PVC4_ZANCU|nr:Monocarboxylate transporter 13 [Zancudomyces culisetae]|eukprot:OMH84901.1 Monocarboxylate transporter 13 [Zancudomyces culisetae]